MEDKQIITVSKVNHYINMTILLVISLIIFSPLISSKYVWGHDSFYHYANIFSLVKNVNFLKFKFIPDKILPIIAYNFGWGEGIFYPSVPQYSVLYLYKFIFPIGITNIFTSMKIIHFIMFFLSGITMYVLGLKIYKNDKSALLCSVFYITFPYYYIDIFVRDALNECFLFVFIPLVFLGLEYLYEGNRGKFYLYFVTGYFFCINCHLVLSVFLTFFVIIYLFFYVKKILNFKIIKSLFIASLIILGLSSFFLIPLVMHSVDSGYVVYLKGVMFNYKGISGSMVKIRDFFDFSKPKSWSGIVLSTTSIPCLIAVIVSIIFIKKNKIRKKLLSFVILIILIIYIMNPLFSWKSIPRFLWNIQFVWRLNTFLLFFLSLLGGSFIVNIKNNLLKSIIIIFFLVFSTLFVSSFKEMLILENFDVNSFDISKIGAASFQYIPVNAYNNLEYAKERSDDVIVVSGNAKIDNVYSNTPYLSFYVKTDGARLELPRYYFKIYDIIANGKKIKYKENDKGFIEIYLKRNSSVVIRENSRLAISCIIIFIVSLILFLYSLFKNRIEDIK